MAVSHGMDVGEVRRLGGSLQTSAGSIDDLIKRIDSAVSVSTWVGPDANTFKGTWWPDHRAHLVAMSEKLYGLGQSAKNNADEQERVSGASGSGASSPDSGGSSDGRLAELRDDIAAMESPERVAEWWNGLSQVDRDALIESDPILIGNLDGVPPDVRYRANKLNIGNYVTDLRAEYADLKKIDLDFVLDPNARIEELARLQEQISRYERVYADGEANILMFDPNNGGRIAQVHGNLSEADRIVVVVPGVSNDLDNFAFEGSNAERLYSATDPGTATIEWLGYDTPSGVTDPGAMDIHMAETGGAELKEFVDGLRSQTDAEMVISAHSYGTVTTTEAAKLGMKVDTVLLLGSPGVAAPNTDVFGNADVYVGANDFDPVGKQVRIPFTTDPMSESFGATIIDSNDGNVSDSMSAHLTYYDEGSTSFNSIVDVVDGIEERYVTEDGLNVTVRVDREGNETITTVAPY